MIMKKQMYDSIQQTEEKNRDVFSYRRSVNKVNIQNNTYDIYKKNKQASLDIKFERKKIADSIQKNKNAVISEN